MNPLFDVNQYNTASSRELLPLKCEKCNNIFYGSKNEIQKSISRQKRGVKHTAFRFCSHKCRSNKQKYECKYCKNITYRTPSQLSKIKNVYCSRKCAAIHTQINGGHCKWSNEDRERIRQFAKNNPNFIPGWNKGKKYAKTVQLKCNTCQKEFIQVESKPNRTQTCSVECRRKIQSSNLKLQYKKGRKVHGGTTKWIIYKNIKVQGSYEYRTCKILDGMLDKKIICKWEYTNYRILYIGKDGKWHNYLLDFKIWIDDTKFYYLEVKGYKTETDELKWSAVKKLGHSLKVWYLTDIKSHELNLMGTVA